MHSSFMEFNFGKLHYQYSSSDKKITILFLHSFNSSAESFLAICSSLQSRFNVFCLDFPGHGLSEHFDVTQHSEDCSFAGLSTILIEFLNRLNIKDFFIVANSMGGNAAVQALSSLQGVKGIILIGSIQAESKEEAFNIMFPSEALSLLFKNELNEQEIDILSSAYVYDPDKTKGSSRKMVHDIRHTDGNFCEQFGRNIETQVWPDELQLLKKSNLNFLYILGLKDGFIDSINYKKLLIKKGVPEPQIKLVDDAGHIVHLDNPDLCAKLIIEFIDSI